MHTSKVSALILYGRARRFVNIHQLLLLQNATLARYIRMQHTCDNKFSIVDFICFGSMMCGNLALEKGLAAVWNDLLRK